MMPTKEIDEALTAYVKAFTVVEQAQEFATRDDHAAEAEAFSNLNQAILAYGEECKRGTTQPMPLCDCGAKGPYFKHGPNCLVWSL